MVLELCKRRANDITTEVVTVMDFGPLEADFRTHGALHSAGRRPKHLGLRAIGKLVSHVRAADVVHTHLFAGDTWGRIAALIARHPVVVTTEHNIDRDETWQRPVRRLLRGTATTVAVSEAVARACTARDVRVIPNGVDLTRFSAPHRGGAGLLAIGRLVPQKGFDVLAKALPDGARLRIVGEGPERFAHPTIEFLGRREDVPELLRDADALVVPSRWEGFGLAALEGMAAGTPVIAANVDGLSEVVADAGVLVAPNDVAALRVALDLVLTDPNKRRELSARGRARAALFPIEQTVHRYESLYRSLLALSKR